MRALFRASAAIRTTARRSLKKKTRGRKRSRPGDPPVNQTNTVRSLISFWVDRRKEQAVIAPAIVSNGGRGVDTLEVGGRSNYGNGGPQAARPFMGPAYEASRKTIEDIWSNL